MRQAGPVFFPDFDHAQDAGVRHDPGDPLKTVAVKEES